MARVREALKSGDEVLLMGEMRRLYQRELRGMMQYNYLSHVNALLMGILTQTCLAGDIPFLRRVNQSISQSNEDVP